MRYIIMFNYIETLYFLQICFHFKLIFNTSLNVFLL